MNTKKMLSTASLTFLSFFLVITYEYLAKEIYILNYFQQLLFLLAGPIGLIWISPKFVYMNPLNGEINYLAIILLVLMISFLSIGAMRFSHSIIYKISFVFGLIFWLMYGLISIGINYIAV